RRRLSFESCGKPAGPRRHLAAVQCGGRHDRVSRPGDTVKEELTGTMRERLDAVIHAQPEARVPELVKAVLIDSMKSGSLAVPSGFRQPIEGTYARRLLHRDPSGKYTMVVMTWGPGQKTALHDHAGIWCVECVVEGNMEVSQYDLTSEV